ncbi:hypothetical protein F5X99DRAFT_375857 [Biscogniauxia marginata]|nr:hypothetical protein F5X99DRAFT_375857 [Biscogniauxia marginata]
MDVLSVAAGIGQLLGQINSLYQQIDAARHAVKTAPEVFANTKAQLDNISDILKDIEHEKNFDTPAIKAQLNLLTTIMNEASGILHSMNMLQGRNRLLQGLHALIHGQRDEMKLVNILTRLERAKGALLLQINVTHVGLTGCLAEEVKKIVQSNEALASREIDRPEITHDPIREGNETTHSNEGAEIAARGGNKRSKISRHARFRSNRPMETPDQLKGRAKTIVLSRNKKPEVVHELVIEENKAINNSNQVNGILGMEGSGVSTTAKVLGNRAIGMSRQQNLILDSSNALQVIRSLCT